MKYLLSHQIAATHENKQWAEWPSVCLFFPPKCDDFALVRLNSVCVYVCMQLIEMSLPPVKLLNNRRCLHWWQKQNMLRQADVFPFSVRDISIYVCTYALWKQKLNKTQTWESAWAKEGNMDFFTVRKYSRYDHKYDTYTYVYTYLAVCSGIINFELLRFFRDKGLRWPQAVVEG